MATTQHRSKSLVWLDAAIFLTLTFTAGLAISTIGLATDNINFAHHQKNQRDWFRVREPWYAGIPHGYMYYTPTPLEMDSIRALLAGGIFGAVGCILLIALWAGRAWGRNRSKSKGQGNKLTWITPLSIVVTIITLAGSIATTIYARDLYRENHGNAKVLMPRYLEPQFRNESSMPDGWWPHGPPSTYNGPRVLNVVEWNCALARVSLYNDDKLMRLCWEGIIGYDFMIPVCCLLAVLIGVFGWTFSRERGDAKAATWAGRTA